MNDYTLICVPCTFQGKDGKEHHSYNFYLYWGDRKIAICVKGAFKSGYAALMSNCIKMDELPANTKTL